MCLQTPALYLVGSEVITHDVTLLPTWQVRDETVPNFDRSPDYIGGPIFRELVGILYLVAYVLCAGSGILGVSIGLNALSDHATCTVWWSFIAAAVVAALASFPKFHQIGWLTWAVSSIHAIVQLISSGVHLHLYRGFHCRHRGDCPRPPVLCSARSHRLWVPCRPLCAGDFRCGYSRQCEHLCLVCWNKRVHSGHLRNAPSTGFQEIAFSLYDICHCVLSHVS